MGLKSQVWDYDSQATEGYSMEALWNYACSDGKKIGVGFFIYVVITETALNRYGDPNVPTPQ